MTLTVGSMFAGIGGIDLGLERAGFRIAWQVENDDYCRSVLKKHWPRVRRYGDVRKVDPTRLKHVDLVAAGFPCQPVSRAGKRRGADDPRWLWPEVARFLRVLRPRFVLLENVPGLLARSIRDVLRDLAACGYDADWDCVPAAAFGAPHRRDRVFIVAYPHGESLRVEPRGPRAEPQSEGAPQPRNDGTAGPLANTDGRRREELRQPKPARFTGKPRRKSDGRGPRRVFDGQPPVSEFWATEPRVGRVVDGFPGRVARLRALGNAVVPQVAEWVGKCVLKFALS